MLRRVGFVPVLTLLALLFFLNGLCRIVSPGQPVPDWFSGCWAIGARSSVLLPVFGVSGVPLSGRLHKRRDALAPSFFALSMCVTSEAALKNPSKPDT